MGCSLTSFQQAFGVTKTSLVGAEVQPIMYPAADGKAEEMREIKAGENP